VEGFPCTELLRCTLFQLFIWVRLAWLEDRPLVLNLAPHHETAARLLEVERHYLLE